MTLPQEEIRAEMIAITLAHMDDGGLEGVKARSIARQAGVSVGTVYNMFGSIDGLIREANSNILEGFASETLARIAPLDKALRIKIDAGDIDKAGALQKRLLSFADIYMKFVEHNESRWSAMLAYNQSRAGGLLPDDYEKQQDSLFSFLGESLVGTNVDTDDKTRRMAARMLWSAVHGIVLLNYIGFVSDEARDYTWKQIEVFVTSFVRGVTN